MKNEIKFFTKSKKIKNKNFKEKNKKKILPLANLQSIIRALCH